MIGLPGLIIRLDLASLVLGLRLDRVLLLGTRLQQLGLRLDGPLLLVGGGDHRLGVLRIHAVAACFDAAQLAHAAVARHVGWVADVDRAGYADALCGAVTGWPRSEVLLARLG